jgi:mannosyltransferase
MLALLTVLAAGLRLSGLTLQSFWYDEAVSVALAQHPLADLLTGRIKDAGNPPLYPALLHLWMGVFGSGDGAVRALSALLGALTVPLLLLVAREVVAAPVALLAAILLALSPYHLQLGQEARGFALLALLSAAASWALLRGTAREIAIAPSARTRWMPWALFALTTAAMAWTHYYGFAVALAHALYLAIEHRRNRAVWLRALAAYAVAALLFAPWLPAMAAQIHLPGNLSRSAASWAWHLAATPLVFTLGTALAWKGIAAAGIDAGVVLGVIVAGLGTLAALVAAGIGVLRTWQRTRQERVRAAIVLLTWLLVPIGLPAVISLFGHPLYNSRYAIAASLPFVVFLAAGLYELGDRQRVVVGGVLAVAMTAATVATLSWFGHGGPYKPQWREAAAFVEAVRRADDLLLFEADHNETAYAHYAGPASGAEIRVRVLGADAGHVTGALHEGDAAVDLTNLVNGHDRVWLIAAEANPETLASLRQFLARWRPGLSTQLRGIAIQRFER